jgi:hypothetical protein
MSLPARTAAVVALAVLLASTFTASAGADVYNLKVVTDASPDYTDMPSMVRSITSHWDTDEQRMWALYYWNHIARRQTGPMILHGKAETDPIRQFNDYGYTMCSTISGINCSIWDFMGYKVRYWDIAVHTVPEVFYDGRWHLYDNSLSNIYTLCDGHTIAGVEDIGKTLSCDASGGKEAAGHIAKYHAVNGTGPNGFLEGADTIRDLAHLGEHTFNPSALKFRSYLIDAERGHRYILNLRDGETYTRYYHRLDAGNDSSDGNEKHAKSDPAYFTPNGTTTDGKPKDPESVNYRYHIRGNGMRTWTPIVTAGPGEEAVYKVEGANVITSLKIVGEATDVSLSVDNGMNWTSVADTSQPVIEPVNGAYEVLVKLRQPHGGPLKFETITQLNSKTQPRLNLGKNTVYVGAVDQTESIVLWPELQYDHYKPRAVEAKNIYTDREHEGWHGVMGNEEKGKEGYVVFKIDAPHDITRINQAARMYLKKPKAEIRFEHSFDAGKTWVKSYTFNDTAQPWDDTHEQVTTEIPKGVKSVLFKYVFKDASVYSIRMEADHRVENPTPGPVEVTFNWSERQADYSLVKRSHTQLVEHLPATYTIDVGGADHPIVDALAINPAGARGGEVKYGYSDGNDAGGEKWVGRWVTYGHNFAQGRPYTVSVPPSQNGWGAGDPDGKCLTDGRVGSSYSGGASYKEGPLYNKGTDPQITVDLGQPEKLGAFRIHIHGYPAQDAIKGAVKDAVDVLTSNDGTNFTPAGKFNFKLRWKDVPVNYMWNDEETFAAHNHTLVLDKPVEARYVRFACKPSRMMVITEVQALDGVKSDPFDLRIALPEAK